MRRLLAVVELPVLNAVRCVACGNCVQVCPTSCLEMRGAGPWLPRPLDCMSCGLCVLVCPVDALSLAAPEPA